MRDEIAPVLRQFGLRGSGQAFSIPSDAYWAQIGFQKSDSSNALIVKFTVNLKVVSREAWAETARTHRWLGAKPSPNTQASLVPGAWDVRIGLLLPSGRDEWWRIEPDTPTAPVAGEVLVAIHDFGLPAMRRRMTDRL